jgi:hypothetical protein
LLLDVTEVAGYGAHQLFRVFQPLAKIIAEGVETDDQGSYKLMIKGLDLIGTKEP